jgi:hypothetical protein
MGEQSIALDWQLKATNKGREAVGKSVDVHLDDDDSLTRKPLEHHARRQGSIVFQFLDLGVDEARELPPDTWTISCADALGTRHVGRWLA